jgi:hypothetical protein
MPVQWRSPARRPIGPIILTVPPDRIVWFLAPPDQYAVIDLHWLPSGKGSYPCLGEDCHLCPDRIETHTYAPVLYRTSLRSGEWMPAVLPCGTPNGDLAQANLVGQCWHVRRFRGSTKFKHNYAAEQIRVTPESAPVGRLPFDVRPVLMARYNIDETAEYFAPRPDGGQGRLDFTSEPSGE